MQKYQKTTARTLVLLTLLAFLIVSGGTASAASARNAVTPARLSYRHVCGAVAKGQARCTAMIATQAGSSKALTVNPFAIAPGGGPPYSPFNLRTAYGLTAYAGSAGETIGIVDAYSDPNLASDLAYFRSTWGLPACTVASGCLRIVNQAGGSTLPASNPNWGLEESLDVDVVSVCLNCHILVVEANSNSLADLGTAANEAAALGAYIVSNSYGAAESSLLSPPSSLCSAYYNSPSVAYTAGSGDQGLGVNYPADCPLVVGVGGTTLNSNGAETDWNTSSTVGAGGGCSAYIPKPSWQISSVTGCGNYKAISDVSADADTNTGIYIYDTYGYSGWYSGGGTSASSPLIAAVYGLSGYNGSPYPASFPWTMYLSGCLVTVGGVRYSYQGGLGSPNDANGISCF